MRRNTLAAVAAVALMAATPALAEKPEVPKKAPGLESLGIMLESCETFKDCVTDGTWRPGNGIGRNITSPVPEPEQWMTFAAGTAMIGFVVAKRKRRM